MGSLNAQGFAEAIDEGLVSLRQALAWHLQSNHYPPVPLAMVDPCVAAIEHAEDGDWSAEVELPEGVTYRGQTTAPVHSIVESHHLESFISMDDEL